MEQKEQEQKDTAQGPGKVRAAGGIAQHLCQPQGLASPRLGKIGLELVHQAIVFEALSKTTISSLVSAQVCCFIYSPFYSANTRAACVCRDWQIVSINPETLRIFSAFAVTADLCI